MRFRPPHRATCVGCLAAMVAALAGRGCSPVSYAPALRCALASYFVAVTTATMSTVLMVTAVPTIQRNIRKPFSDRRDR